MLKKKACKKTTKRGKWSMEYNVKVAVTPVKRKKKGNWKIASTMQDSVTNKTYVDQGHLLSKSDAQKVAKANRELGFPSRVIKRKSGYKVFSQARSR